MNLKKVLKTNENRVLALGLGSILWVFIIMNIPYWFVMYQKSVNGVERSFSPWIGLTLVAVGLVMAICGTYFGVKGYKKGERSGKLMMGLVASVAILIMALMFLVGEFIFPH